jgi:hypothetical protein
MKTFGTNFVLVSDVVQIIPKLAMGTPPERVVHHATVRRGNKEYLAMASEKSNHLYLNQVERSRATFALQEIEDDVEYAELVDFLTAAGIFNAAGPKKHAN